MPAMVAQNQSDPAQAAAWGAALANHLRENFPNLAAAAREGVALDCTAFISSILSNDATTAQFTAICTVFENALARQTHQINQNDVTIFTLQEQVQLLARAGRSAPRRITVDPEKFSGSDKDIAVRQQKYVNWRSQINRCFVVDSEVFDTELRRIQFISGLLTDDAYDVNRDFFDTITENPHNPERWHWQSAKAVFQDLNTQYQTMDLSLKASQDFDNLYMTNKPFQNFVADFNRLASKCGKTPEQKVEALRKKVSQELSDALAILVIGRPAKTDFDGWSRLCQDVYNSLEEQKHIDRLRNNRPGSQNPNRAAQNQSARGAQNNPTPDAGDPMVLDAARPRPTRNQCREHNLCFYCKKPGHTVSNCEEKKRADARWGQPGMAPPQEQTASPQFGYGRGRGQPYNRDHAYPGRGQYYNSLVRPQNAQSRPAFNNPASDQNYQYPGNRFRQIEPGFVEGEITSSTTGSPPSSFTPSFTPSFTTGSPPPSLANQREPERQEGKD
jgi:hypothetical protein